MSSHSLLCHFYHPVGDRPKPNLGSVYDQTDTIGHLLGTDIASPQVLTHTLEI